MRRTESTKVKDSPVDPAIIETLIVNLNCDEVITCQKARRQLVSLGKPAVPSLIEALSSRKPWVRWEAAKALGEIRDTAAAQALVKALRDRRSDVRWLAAEALIAMGRDGVIPLLRDLIKNSDALWLRQGAHHVFHDLKQTDLKAVLQPVLIALEDIEPTIEVPIAARKVLDAMQR